MSHILFSEGRISRHIKGYPVYGNEGYLHLLSLLIYSQVFDIDIIKLIIPEGEDCADSQRYDAAKNGSVLSGIL